MFGEQNTLANVLELTEKLDQERYYVVSYYTILLRSRATKLM